MVRPNPTHLARRGAAGRLVVVALAALVLGGAIASLIWLSVAKKSVDAATAEQNQMFKQLTLGEQKVTNQLDARYTDADGNLIADPPADAAKQLDPPALMFSYVAIDDAAEFKTAFADFLKYLSQQTGKPCEYAEFPTTTDQLRALRDGKLHVTGFNTGGVPIAVNAAGFVPVSLLAAADGNGMYKMQIIARADSHIQKLGDLKGHELCLTEASSNSGYKAPLVLLKEQGLEPGRDYGIRYSLGQDASIEGVAAGTYEVAAVASDVLKRAIGAGRIKENQFRVIHESNDFPSAALGYAHNLKPDLAAKIRDALTKFDWSNSSMAAYFTNAGQSRFAPADFKKDWELVRRIDNEIGYEHTIPEPATQPAGANAGGS